MAAAEYFNPNISMTSHSGPQQNQPPPQYSQQPPSQQSRPPRQQQPPPPASQSQANLSPPYPTSDQPPPYTFEQQRPHSQPPPAQRLPQPNYTGAPYPQQYPSNAPGPANYDTHQYPPEKVPAQRPGTLQNGPRVSDYTATHPPAFPGNVYSTPVAPGLSGAYAGGQAPWPQQRPSSSGNPNHRRSSRSRSHERRKHHKPQSAQPGLQRQKSSGFNTFLGAGGGAIIGDLIFPGLGTLSGAVLGGIGGHEYGKGKQRSSSNPGRTGRRSYSGDEEDYRRGRR